VEERKRGREEKGERRNDERGGKKKR